MTRILHCSAGDHDLPDDAFWVNRASPTGRMASCKTCVLRMRRNRNGWTKPRPKRLRTVIGGVAYVSCLDCGLRPSTDFNRRKVADDRYGHELSLCKKCGSRRRSQAYQKKLLAEMKAPLGAPTPLMDALERTARKSLDKQLAKSREERRDLLALVRFRIPRLRALGLTWKQIADIGGVCVDTPPRWMRDDSRLPDAPPMRRAIAAWDRMLFVGDREDDAA